MTAVGDARKRRQESVLADETVRVPAADLCQTPGCGHGFDQHSPHTPQPCHYQSSSTNALGSIITTCHCRRFTPAALSSPRRTRDEGTEDEAVLQAVEDWVKALDSTRKWNLDHGRGEGDIGIGWVVRQLNGLLAGFRAARLAGEDDER